MGHRGEWGIEAINQKNDGVYDERCGSGLSVHIASLERGVIGTIGCTTMADTTAEHILRVDCFRRVTTTRERRAALLAEFDRSGVSGQRLAKWAGIISDVGEVGAKTS
jgi:hypothetical protein